jgi:integrase/recombinase XerD
VKKSIIVDACENVPGFIDLYHDIQKEIVISGRSASMLDNYTRHLAKIAITLNCVPTELSPEQIRDYLYDTKLNHERLSESYFKFTVYSLRLAFRLSGQNDKLIRLPTFKKNRKLPVILSREEIKKLLAVTENLKHRLLLLLLYGCGLRCGEIRNIRIADIDFDRMMLFVKNGKGGKDRYVPLSAHQVEELQEFIAKEGRTDYLFGKPRGRAGGDFDGRYSQRGITWVLTNAGKKATIIKKISPHVFRHSYATHLLEDGLDIFTIKDLLGHSRIETTMVYFHVSHFDRVRAFSPLDTLYDSNHLARMRSMIVFSEN